MFKKAQVVVEPRPDGRWAVQTNSTSRANSLHEQKAAAIERARQVAKSKKAELVIKNGDGKIASRDSFGNDPFPPRA